MGNLSENNKMEIRRVSWVSSQSIKSNSAVYTISLPEETVTENVFLNFFIELDARLIMEQRIFSRN